MEVDGTVIATHQQSAEAAKQKALAGTRANR